MPLQATSGAASYDAFGGGVAAVPQYIEDVFSTYLYTGNGSTQTITNGIDLSTKGGLVWIKSRSAVDDHNLYDTVRGAQYSLSSNLTEEQTFKSNSLTAFNTTGFSLGSNTSDNTNSRTYASWTFRRQPKFFDVVTWTGSNDSGTSIGQGIVPHNLGSAPGCVIIKNVTQGATNWIVYHKSLSGGYRMLLNTTDAQTNTSPTAYFSKYVSGVGWTQTNPDANNIYVGYNYQTNGNTDTLVAYLFADNAGGFGLTGTDNVISCGSYTSDGAGNATIDLGYEPQLVWVKAVGVSSDWYMWDTMRGLDMGNDSPLYANSSAAEATQIANRIDPLATGFKINGFLAANAQFIYIAIRRGPMKVPTSGTSVFVPAIGNNSTSAGGEIFTTNFPVDFFMRKVRATTDFAPFAYSRLTAGKYLVTGTTAAEATDTSTWFDTNTGIDYQYVSNFSGQIGWLFQRAPSFMDVVCYTGTGATPNVLTHNLGVVPELIICKRRNNVGDWIVYSATLGNASALYLHLAIAAQSTATAWNSTDPTSTTFTLGNNSQINTSGATGVAYLFASCAGVSKVGSYTGDGTVGRVIDCGFTGGARFIMLKKTSTTSNWYVYDTARGIVSGDEKSLSLNTTAAESGASDVIDPDSSGFAVGTGASDFFNESGVTYIFLAIA